MLRRYLCIASMLFVVSAVCSAQETLDLRRRVEVTGTAVTQVAPDIIIWSLSTTDENINLQEAKAGSDRKFSAIMALVKELGIAPEDVQTGYANVSREYNQDKEGRRTTFKGYSVRRGVTAKQLDMARFDEYFGKFLASADMEASFRLDSSKMEQVRWDTRLRATELAKEKAEAMAKATGARLGKALYLGEPTNEVMPRWSNGSMAMDMQADQSTGTFAPGALEVKVSINAVYELQ